MYYIYVHTTIIASSTIMMHSTSSTAIATTTYIASISMIVVISGRTVRLLAASLARVLSNDSNHSYYY